MRHWIDRRATHILGVGEAALAHGWRADWQRDPRCAVIHNGLDTAPFAAPADRTGVRREFGWPEDCPLLIHVGRMCPPKNHPRLVEIAGRIMHGVFADAVAVGRRGRRGYSKRPLRGGWVY